MLNLKNNLTKFLFLFFALAIPATGCAMEDSTGDVMEGLRMAHYEACLDADDSDVGSWPGYIMGGMKNATVYGMETALEHPVGVVVCGSALGLLLVWKHYVASGKDLKKSAKRIKAHSNKEWARVKKVNTEHATQTNKKLTVLIKGNEYVDANLDEANKEFNVTSDFLEELFGKADILSTNQDEVFNIMDFVVEGTNEQGLVCIAALNNMKKDTEELEGYQSSIKRDMAFVSNALKDGKLKLLAFVNQLSKDGKNKKEIEEEVGRLGMKVQNLDQLLVDSGSKLILSKEDSNENNNNEEEQE